MKKTLALLMLVSICTGCASTKKTAATATVAETSHAVRNENESGIVVTTESRRTDTGVETVQVTEEYDTSQPTVPETGTPPLKRRTTTTMKQTANDNREVAQCVEALRTAQADSTATRQAEATEREDAKPAAGGWQWLKAGALVGAILITLIIVIFNHIKNKLKPF